MNQPSQKTSLSQQLNSLKIQQQDEITLPSRSKISFLFDINKAANIDDQTIYFLCQRGMQDLQLQAPSLYIALQEFQHDIFNISSLQFYRGQKTQEQLKSSDQKLDIILRQISPHLLLEPVHKIVEYLIRIYEVHVHQKHSFVFCFLPYFETVFCIKAIQLVNIKDDEYFSFLYEFGYRGQALDGGLILKAFKRQSALLFVKYAQWFFQANQYWDPQAANLQVKFLGTMMAEVLKLGQNDQSLMLNILPFISQSLKSVCVDLKNYGLLCISVIVSRNALSQQYSHALFQQILILMKCTQLDEPFRLRCLNVLMIIIDRQNFKIIEPQDIQALLEIPKFQKLIQKASQKHDISQLINMMIISVIECQNEQIQSSSMIILQRILSQSNNFINLKTLFCSLNNLIALLQEESKGGQYTKNILSIINILKQMDQQKFNLTIIYQLKQIQDKNVKEQLKQIIYGDQKGYIYQNVGDQEYSLLSAIGSSKKQVKLTALHSLADKEIIHHLLDNETNLIVLFLAQIIQRCEDDEETFSAMVTALSNLIHFQKNQNQNQNLLFEPLEKMLQFSYKNYQTDGQTLYSAQIIQKVVSICVNLTVDTEQNLKKQALIAYFFEKKKCESQYCSFLREYVGQELEKNIQLNMSQSFQFLLEALKKHRNYFDFEKIDYLLSLILSACVVKDKKVENQLSVLQNINLILKQIKLLNSQKNESIIQNLLSSVIKYLPKRKELVSNQEIQSITIKCLKNIIVITLQEKQMNGKFNLLKIHNQIYSDQFDDQDKLIIEFHMQNALKVQNHHNKSSLKRIFSIMYIIDYTKQNKQFVIDHPMILSFIMMLLGDNDVKVRYYALILVEALASADHSKSIIYIFEDTDKPRSAKKDNTKPGRSPIKPAKAILFLDEILQQKNEIIQDKSQLKTFIVKSKNQIIFEILLRTLLDWPSFLIKAQLLEVLSEMDNFQMVFLMTLSDLLGRFYSFQNIQVGNQNFTDELNMLFSLSKLINKTCQNSVLIDSINAQIMSLVVPLMEFIIERYPKNIGSVQAKGTVDETLYNLSVQSLFKEEILKDIEGNDFIKIFKLYLNLQKYLDQNTFKSQIKNQFGSISFNSVTGETLDNYILDTKRKVQKIDAQEDLNEKVKFVQQINLESTLETILLLKLKNDHLMINSLTQLLKAQVCQALKVQDDQFNFGIELTSQIIIQILENDITKKNSDLNATGSALKEILNLCTLKLREEVDLYLCKKEIDVDDPFNMFLMAIDQTQSNQGVISNIEIYDSFNYIQILQVIKSLASVLLSGQKMMNLNFYHILKDLFKNIVCFIGDLQERKEARSVKYQEIITQLFRFYHREVIKSIDFMNRFQVNGLMESTQALDYLKEYVFALKILINNFSQGNNNNFTQIFNQTDSNHIKNLLNIVDALGFEQYAHMFSLILITFARDSFSIQDNDKIISRSPLLDFAKKIMLESIKKDSSLNSIQNILLDLTCMPIGNSMGKFVDLKMKIISADLQKQSMFNKNWLLQQPEFQISRREMRQVKILTMYILEEQLLSDSEFERELALIAGQDPSLVVQEQFLNCYLALGIMKDSVNNYLVEKDFKNEKEPKQAKISTKVLYKRVDSMLNTFNNMISHEIHASMVLKIMNLDNSDILNLKTNAVQLLLNKTGDFYSSLSLLKQLEMVKIFEPLVLEAIRCLNDDMNVKTLQKNPEKQSYTITLLALFSKTACKQLDQSIKEKVLRLSFQLIDDQDKFPLTLVTQLILTQTQLFEVYQTEILESLPLHIIQLLKAFERYFSSTDEFFRDSFIRSILKSSLSLVTIFGKFINTQQLESIIKNVLVVDKSYENEVAQIFDVISNEGPKTVGLKQLFQAVFNSFDQVLIQDGVQSLKLSANISNISIRFFSHILKPVMMRIKKDFCAEYYQKINTFFKEVFAFPYEYYKQNNQVDMQILDEVEETMIEAFKQFILKLNEDQLGPVIFNLVKWAQKIPKDQRNLSVQINMHRQIILFKALSAIVQTLGEYAVPLIRLQINNTSEILGSLIKIFTQMHTNNSVQVGKKRSKINEEFGSLKLLESDESNDQGHTMCKLLFRVCENIQLNFKNDSSAFIQSDIFEIFAEPLVAQLVSLSSLGKYFNKFIDEQVKPLVFEMMERINNDTLWIQFTNAILMKSRIEYSWEIRLASLKVIDHMFNKLGERYLVVLNDALAFISESLEDDNQDVEFVAKSIVKRIETLTGESIQAYLK